MKFTKKLFVGSSLLGLMSHGTLATAQGVDSIWQARQLSDVIDEIVMTEDNAVSYTIKYGDTLSVISDAMDIELRYLAEINDILDVDLIHPKTTLTAYFDANQQAESMTVDSPNGDVVEVNIPVNLSPLPEVEPVEELPADESSVVGGVTIEEMFTENDFIIEEEIETPVQEEDYSLEVQANEEVAVYEDTVEEVIEPEIEVETPVIEEKQVISEQEEVYYEEEPSLENSIIEDFPSWTEVEPEYSEETPAVEEPIVELPEESYEYEEEVIYEEELVAPEEEIVYEEEPVAPEEEIVYEEEPVASEEEIVYEEPAEPSYDPMTNPENAGLQPHVAAYKEEVASIYGVDSFNTYRAGDPQDHGQGLAVDFMVPVGSQVGDDIANYSVNNMAENNISYVIWEQQIYGDWNYQWEAMEDRGSTTANHYDHVHVSFY